ncbi:MAG: tetratricopeptide repeat protein [Bdellovibrionaceae bacterium]|nr:tetratricopeptide repeat protein [Pseudobdellovibrionaceae bacterium]
MKNQAVFSITLILLGLWSLAYIQFQQYFENPQKYEEKIQKLQKNIAKTQMQKELLKDQLIEFQMDVAKILPETIRKSPKGEKSYPLRNLASLVLAKDQDAYQNSKMKTHLSLSKKLFTDKKYKDASQSLVQFISNYPFSIDIAEAFFLLAESYFQLEDYERCILTVEKMIELFPENELTGYAMVRMGKIYEIQERPEQAIDIYQTVLQVFPVRGLASQAKESLKSVEL